MPVLNSVVLVGHVGRDPKLRYYESGKVQAVFTLAVKRPLRRGEEADPVTDWFTIELWGKQAEVVGNYVHKGSLLGIEGRLEFHTFTDPSGNAYSSPYIAASGFRFLGAKEDQAGEARA